MDAVWWKWLDINYGSKPCVERAWWDLLEVVKNGQSALQTSTWRGRGLIGMVFFKCEKYFTRYFTHWRGLRAYF